MDAAEALKEPGRDSMNSTSRAEHVFYMKNCLPRLRDGDD